MNGSGLAKIEINGLRIDLPGPPWLETSATVAIVITFFWSVAWIWRDAEQRGKSGCLAQLFLVLTWPVSILWWLWLRPPLDQPQEHSSSPPVTKP
jgi:hypothetical protein